MDASERLLLSQTVRAFRLLILAGIVFLAGAAAPAPVESTHLKLIVGLTDDTAKWMTRQDGIVGVHRDLRLMAVRVTIPWQPGQVTPTRLQQVYVHRIARMIQLNDRIVVAVYNRAHFAPVTRRGRNDYCAFLQGMLRRLPLIHDVEIWNEANSPTYWPQRDGARTYAALLARCYDVLHSRSPAANVISSTASRHDPAGFVFVLGDAYLSLGRARPLFDTFGHKLRRTSVGDALRLGPARRGRLRDADERPPDGVRRHGTAAARHARSDNLVRRGRLPDGPVAREASVLPRSGE